MFTDEFTQAEWHDFRHMLQDTVDEQASAFDIPSCLIRAVHTAGVDTEKKRRSLGFIRSWVRYSQENLVDDDPYTVRYHITQFAAQELGERLSSESLSEVALSEIPAYQDLLSTRVSPAILNDPDVAIVGGAARLALKLFAGVDTQAELPISDIDAVMANTKDVAQKAQTYGIDLSGAKIVDGDIREKLDSMATNFDCTINQVAIYDGKLLYSQRALEDIREGNIRLIAKNDPLFGSEGIVLPDGHVYINRVGFYRGLSFLLRGKGKQLIVSKENIEREKESIGRYWQVILFVKLLPMKDEAARYKAIGHWHELAQRLGVTETTNPGDFLRELAEAFPDTQSGAARQFNADSQARWIIKRLINEASSRLYPQTEFTPPPTYREANLSLSDTFVDYDKESFFAAVRAVQNK